MSEQIPEGWIAHDGGEPDLPNDAWVRPMFRGEPDPAKGIRRAFGFVWQFAWYWDGNDDDILAYKPENPND